MKKGIEITDLFQPPQLYNIHYEIQLDYKTQLVFADYYVQL